MEYITKEAAQKCLDDLSSDNLIGNENDTFISVAEAKDRIEELPTADVAPKREVAREIFEEIEKLLITNDFEKHYGYPVIAYNHFGYAELKKKYTEGAE